MNPYHPPEDRKVRVSDRSFTCLLCWVLSDVSPGSGRSRPGGVSGPRSKTNSLDVSGCFYMEPRSLHPRPSLTSSLGITLNSTMKCSKKKKKMESTCLVQRTQAGKVGKYCLLWLCSNWSCGMHNLLGRLSLQWPA